jgi:Asp-tRNA(Asn)/Glu-tRNA(Gln) amidotransferase A subunit family amidase
VTGRRGFHFPAEVISHAVWLYARFALSYRDVEELLAERGIQVSYESVRRWVHRFGEEFTPEPLRAADGQCSDRGSVEEQPVRGQQFAAGRRVSVACATGICTRVQIPAAAEIYVREPGIGVPMHVPASPEKRMRTNLAAAGIPLEEADLDGIRQGGFLGAVTAFDERSAGWPGRHLPDYLYNAVDAAAAPGGESVADERVAPPTPSRARPRSGSIAAVSARIRARDVSPVELAEQALARIEERDPVLNAFQRVTAEQAIASARRAEREIASGAYRGPLHGVPVAIKDLLAMSGTETTAGTQILAGQPATYDAAAVERLEGAGAIIVGKTRMSEFAYLPGSNNAHYGPTRNPSDPERDAGGSSSGSAAAVADGMVYAAIGSDTGGSIRIPAAFCGIVGLKPTFGRISLHGVVPLSWSLDHLGPLTRTVADAATLLGILAGHDPRDPRTRWGVPAAIPADLEAGVAGVRIGVPEGEPIRSSLGTREVWTAAERSLAALEGAGAELVPVRLPELHDLWIINNAILALEAAGYHEPWLRTRLHEYGEIPRRRLLAAYAYPPGAFVRAQTERRVLRERMTTLLERIELFAMPTQPAGAPPLGTPGGTLPTAPFNALGWPALTVPSGRTGDGLPLGLQLVGRPWDEATVLRAGWVVEGAPHEPGLPPPVC